MAHFEIKDLTFTYPGAEKQALRGVNLSIERGQYITLCGKSGSGKTTLMRHLKSVLAPHGERSGQVLFGGKELSESDMREQSAKIGYVMQNPDSQIVTDKVWHELAFGLESLGCDQRTMRMRVAEMANYFGIQTWFHRKVSDLSGGQKQLLNLASIMAMQPEALILDEPTSQLDPIAAADFLNTVRKINLELGTTVILSEHRLEEVFPAADRVIVMERGRILADDTPVNIGRKLEEEKSDLVAALPAPMRIYYGVRDGLREREILESGLRDFPEPAGKTAEEETADAEAGPAGESAGSGLPKIGQGSFTERAGRPPLTVREGRSWLSREFEGREIKIKDLPDEEVYEDPEDPAVELKEVWFRYGKDLPDVLKGVSLKIPKGKLSAVVGGNGTGKSTMLKAVCDICRPYRGKILVDGKRVDKYKSAELFNGNLAMLPQDPQSLFVKKTVLEDLQEMLAGRVKDKAERERLIASVSEDCEITELLQTHPYDLSGGEQQRAALAKVLLCGPRILLLDEPTKGIDSFYKQKLARILKRMMEKGVTVLMVSHDVEFCAQYADYVSMFFDGGIVTTNTPSRFFAQNSFYTTAANRMSRHLFGNAVTDGDVVRLYLENREIE